MNLRPWPEVEEILAPLSAKERADLEASIKRDGVQHPILALPDGRIIDGHHRYQVAPDTSVRILEISEADGFRLAQALNIARRQLSEEQIRELRNWQRETALRLRSEGKTQEESAEAVGVDRSTVARWEERNDVQEHNVSFDLRIAVPKEEHSRILERVEAGEPQRDIAADYKITKRRVEQIVKAERKRQQRAAEIAEIAANLADYPNGPFDVIVIDPPWPYGTKYDPSAWTGRVANPYPEMSLEAIAAEPIADKAADDCILWLWTTHKFMRHSFAILDTWGFRDVSILTWAKDHIGTGHWLRSRSEFCIMAVKGKPEVTLTNQSTVLTAPMREHSRKPDEFYEMVEALCPGPRRTDWFTRQVREGWIPFGNEPERFAS